jgi:hypothetical protein
MGISKKDQSVADLCVSHSDTSFKKKSTRLQFFPELLPSYWKTMAVWVFCG